jgi:hypothetical protein
VRQPVSMANFINVRIFLRRAQVGHGHNTMSFWLKVLLNVFLALAVAIGAVFIWIGVTGDPIVIGLIPAYVVIVVWSLMYYFITKPN